MEKESSALIVELRCFKLKNFKVPDLLYSRYLIYMTAEGEYWGGFVEICGKISLLHGEVWSK